MGVSQWVCHSGCVTVGIGGIGTMEVGGVGVPVVLGSCYDIMPRLYNSCSGNMFQVATALLVAGSTLALKYCISK